MVQDYETIDPFARRPRGRVAPRIWVVVGLLVYAGFVATTFYMEALARERFAVPSRADIESIGDRKARIRVEGARTKALADMRSWTPYSTYRSVTGVIIIGGSVAATIVGAIATWRGVRRDSIFKVKLIVGGVLLVMMASLLLFAWPSFVAERRLEATRTAASGGP
jgi:hypothetical protein